MLDEFSSRSMNNTMHMRSRVQKNGISTLNCTATVIHSPKNCVNDDSKFEMNHRQDQPRPAARFDIPMKRKLLAAIQDTFPGNFDEISQGLPPSTDTQGFPLPSLICHGCKQIIKDMWLYKIDNFTWHEGCTQCTLCQKQLVEKCFVFREKLYCSKDYQNVRQMCDGCGRVIVEKSPVTVMKMAENSYTFHIHCFTCKTCKKEIRPKEEVHFLHVVLENATEKPNPWQCAKCWSDQNKAILTSLPSASNSNMTSLSPGMSSDVTDMNLSPKSTSFVLSLDDDDDRKLSSDDASGHNDGTSLKEDNELEKPKQQDNTSPKSTKSAPKRARTILTTGQRKLFKETFFGTPKPCRKVREELAKACDLQSRVVQVWFQNQRAKMKKIKKRKDAEEAALMKAHGVLGYSNFNHFPHGPHQIQNFYSPCDVISEPMYDHLPTYHHAALQSHMQLQQGITDISMLPKQLSSLSEFPSNNVNMPNITMERPFDNTIFGSNDTAAGEALLEDGHHSESALECDGFQISLPDGLATSEYLVTTKESKMRFASHNVDSPINGLFSMQSNYFNH